MFLTSCYVRPWSTRVQLRVNLDNTLDLVFAKSDLFMSVDVSHCVVLSYQFFISHWIKLLAAEIGLRRRLTKQVNVKGTNCEGLSLFLLQLLFSFLPYNEISSFFSNSLNATIIHYASLTRTKRKSCQTSYSSSKNHLMS